MKKILAIALFAITALMLASAYLSSRTSPSQVTNSTASWKTYTEPVSGLSFRYNPTQTVERFELNSIYGGKGIVVRTKYGNSAFNNFDLFIDENQKGISFEKFVKDNTTTPNAIFQDKNLGIIKGVLAEFPFYAFGGGAEAAHLEYYMIDKNNSLYKMRFYPRLSSESPLSDTDRKFFNQILSTFKFTDQNQTNTSNWKTYTNSQFNILFQYPPNWQVLDNDYSNAIEITNDSKTIIILLSKGIYPYGESSPQADAQQTRSENITVGEKSYKVTEYITQKQEIYFDIALDSSKGYHISPAVTKVSEYDRLSNVIKAIFSTFKFAKP